MFILLYPFGGFIEAWWTSFPARLRGGAALGNIVLMYLYTYQHEYILHLPRQSSKRCPQFQQDFNLTTDQTGVFNSTIARDVAVPVNASVEDLDNIPLSEVQGFKEPALPWYSDQVLPFDVTIACANEYGAAASAKLFGVEILNEGFGASVDDSVLEAQATFVARSVSPLHCGPKSCGMGKNQVSGVCRTGAPPSRDYCRKSRPRRK
jgi:hypothetical protein